MGRRDPDLGHRDCIPEGDFEFIRWSRNFVFRTRINANRWGIPPVANMLLDMQYKEAKARIEECGPEPPPEPDPIDGFTIYWDRNRRFEELFCDFHGVPVDKNGCFNRDELARKMLNEPEWRQRWNEYLMSYVRENAARYNMPPEWAENVRCRVEEALRQSAASRKDGKDSGKNDGDSDMIRYILLSFQSL